MNRLIIGIAVLTMLITVPGQAREGFGFKKKAVTLDRRVPPRVLLVGNRFDVRVTENAGDRSAADDLLERVVSRMSSGDRRFQRDEKNPQLMVELEIRESEVDEDWTRKTEYERRQIGTKIETDSKGNRKEKAEYASVPVEVRYEEIEGTVSARYRVIDSRSKKELYHSDERSSYRESFREGSGSPSRSETIDKLVAEVGAKIAAALVGTTEPISVLIPRASFESLIPMAEQGNWLQYLGAVEKVPVKKSPQDEAYRQYALGVAREALAYAAEEETDSLDLLRKAAVHYRQAVTMNPKEELFSQEYENFWTGGEATSPLERVESAADNYETLHRYRLELSASTAPKKSVPPSKNAAKTAVTTKPPPKTSSTSKGKAVTNASVVEMTKAGLSDENIILAIDAASTRSFDVSPDGLIALAKSGVSRGVIAHMQKKK